MDKHKPDTCVQHILKVDADYVRSQGKFGERFADVLHRVIAAKADSPVAASEMMVPPRESDSPI